MGFLDRFKKRKPDFDPIYDLTLARLVKGDLVDYDMKTWEIADVFLYDYDEPEKEKEWKLVHSRETVFISQDPEDESWCVVSKIPVGKLPKGIREQIIQDGDPPEQITLDGTVFYLDETGAGHFFENDKQVQGTPFAFWDYVDDEDELALTIEQWSETDIEVYQGVFKESYHFSNLLPGDRT